MTEENECRKCGHCCWICFVTITEEEAKSGQYITMDCKEEGYSDKKALPKRLVLVKDVDKAVEACWYFDEKTNLCSIYDRRPKACREWFCKGTQVIEKIKSREQTENISSQEMIEK